MTPLLIATIGHVFSALLFILLGIFVISRDSKRLLYVLFSGFAICSGIFGIFLAIGINLSPSPFAYSVWMVNAIDFFIVAFFFHFTVLLTHREKFYRFAVYLSYAVAISGFVGAFLFPSLFLPAISPKLFTLSYLNAGPIYTLMVAYFVVAPAIAAYELIRGYLKYTDERRRYEYFMLALLIGYASGPSDFFLVYNIPVSPIFGIFYGWYGLPIAYGIVSDQLLDIRVVIKRVLVYSVGIGLTVATFVALTLINNQIVASYPWVQFWTIPAISALVAFAIGRAYWAQGVEADELKYEFITVAAHKLRTPLTRIRWMIDGLAESNDPAALHQGLDLIGRSNNQLIEITNILLESAHTENAAYEYKKEEVKLGELIKTVVEQQDAGIRQKQHGVSVHAPTEMLVTGDKIRLLSVLDVLLENAVAYTPKDGKITITLSQEGKNAKVSIADNGIGILPENKPHIFSRFYRSRRARNADTEGLGLGLFMAQNIIKKHHGRMGVSSPGEGQGSIFWFTVPLRHS